MVSQSINYPDRTEVKKARTNEENSSNDVSNLLSLSGGLNPAFSASTPAPNDFVKFLNFGLKNPLHGVSTLVARDVEGKTNEK